MAKYKESWDAYDDPTVTSYEDTENPGRFLLATSPEVADWIADGNTPDPAYTPEEIAAFEGVEADAAARAYLIETGPIITTYNDDITRRGKSKIKATKAARIARHRERARRRLINPYPIFNR